MKTVRVISSGAYSTEKIQDWSDNSIVSFIEHYHACSFSHLTFNFRPCYLESIVSGRDFMYIFSGVLSKGFI